MNDILEDLPSDLDNPFFTQFRYSKVNGIGREEGVTRRDPSSILRVNDIYYVYYTRRKTIRKIREGIKNLSEQDWMTPVTDWDLSEIWYATSLDGFDWHEKGIAAFRGPKESWDGRTICTPDVLAFGNRYYLYYQAVAFPKMKRSRNVIGMSWAESPDGPWHRFDKPLLKPGNQGEWRNQNGDDETVSIFGDWDSHKIHDPYVIVRDGKIWLYYKGQPMGWHMKNSGGIGWGVAFSEKPEGPFIKSKLNPITNSGHETCLFPWGSGVASIITHDGPEKDSIQYAEDGINFKLVSNLTLPPPSAGPFCADKFSNTKEGKGIFWGLAHLAQEETKEQNSFLIRFDCDLNKVQKRHGFKNNDVGFNEDVLLSNDLIASNDQISWEVNKKIINKIDEPKNRKVLNPTGDLSLSTKRNHEIYGVYKDDQNELFTAFKYFPLTGFPYEDGFSRNTPSKVIFHKGEWHVWYDCINKKGSEIRHASSLDGLVWSETKACIIKNFTNPDILKWKGCFFLYVVKKYLKNNKIVKTKIFVLESPSPLGPWGKLKDLGLFQIHQNSPYLLVRQGLIWLYFNQSKRLQTEEVEWRVLVSDEAKGPYNEISSKPVLTSGYEVFFFPHSNGVVAIAGYTGPYKNTVFFSENGFDFFVKGKLSAPPLSGGPYVPDAFTHTKVGIGISWGLAEMEAFESSQSKSINKLVRFECNLTKNVDRTGFFRPWNFRYPEKAYLGSKFILTNDQKIKFKRKTKFTDINMKIYQPTIYKDKQSE